MYAEYAQAIDEWVRGFVPGTRNLQPRKGNNWAKAATWASVGAGGKIRGEFPAILTGVQQTFADGNQWIFNDIGVRYAALVELTEQSTNPTPAAWEAFFQANFGPGDQVIRVGFLALIAAHYETDPARAQKLMLQSTMLFLTHEQAGAQPYLKDLDLVFPDGIEALFANIDFGVGRTVHTADDIGPDLSIDLNSATAPVRYADNLIWSTNLLSLDPAGQDASVIFDAAGFNVQVGSAPSGPTVDLAALTGLGSSVPTAWQTWRTSGAHELYVEPNTGYSTPEAGVCDSSPYCGTAAYRWWDWEERMWYLLNLFRVLNNDQRVARPPAHAELSDPRFAVYDPGVIQRLSV
jgi:hypothetical protein